MTRSARSLSFLAVLALGCGGDSATDDDTLEPNDTVTSDSAGVADTVEDVADDTVGLDVPDATPWQTEIVIVHTANERGWLAGRPTADGVVLGGAAQVAGVWAHDEPPERLTLSTGDSIVGAPVASWFAGTPTVEVMNAMGYDAVALGHHELDFGRAALAGWIDAAEFSFLAANVEVGSGPAMLDAGYQVFTVESADVAVIGLAHPDTPTLAAGPHYTDVAFSDPATSVASAATAARAEGADAVVVLAHLDSEGLDALATALDGQVDVILGGHSNPHADRRIGDVLVVESSQSWAGYTRVRLTIDLPGDVGSVIAATAEWRPADYDPRIEPDPTVAAAVDTWVEAMDEALGDVIGYTSGGMTQGGWTQANWVTDSWRSVIPEADVVLQNNGGLRATLAPGDIAREDVVMVLPYDNSIISLEMTGEQLLTHLSAGVAHCGGSCFVAVSGLRYGAGVDTVTVELEDGSPLDPTATYTVLMNDYMYYGGAGFDVESTGIPFEATGLNYRDPVMQWTEAQATTESSPLDALLDGAPRNTLD